MITEINQFCGRQISHLTFEYRKVWNCFMQTWLVLFSLKTKNKNNNTKNTQRPMAQLMTSVKIRFFNDKKSRNICRQRSPAPSFGSRTLYNVLNLFIFWRIKCYLAIYPFISTCLSLGQRDALNYSVGLKRDPLFVFNRPLFRAGESQINHETSRGPVPTQSIVTQSRLILFKCI